MLTISQRQKSHDQRGWVPLPRVTRLVSGSIGLPTYHLSPLYSFLTFSWFTRFLTFFPLSLFWGSTLSGRQVSGAGWVILDTGNQTQVICMQGKYLIPCTVSLSPTFLQLLTITLTPDSGLPAYCYWHLWTSANSLDYLHRPLRHPYSMGSFCPDGPLAHIFNTAQNDVNEHIT